MKQNVRPLRNVGVFVKGFCVRENLVSDVMIKLSLKFYYVQK